jgi:hypothetical protein
LGKRYPKKKINRGANGEDVLFGLPAAKAKMDNRSKQKAS